jgi:hypothetical protein
MNLLFHSTVKVNPLLPSILHILEQQKASQRMEIMARLGNYLSIMIKLTHCRKYLELEKEAEKYKDIPSQSFFIIDYNMDLYNPYNNEKVLCSRQIREEHFNRMAHRMMRDNDHR